jgi:hypothetical protein
VWEQIIKWVIIGNVFATEWLIQFAARMHRGLTLYLRGTPSISAMTSAGVERRVDVE